MSRRPVPSRSSVMVATAAAMAAAANQNEPVEKTAAAGLAQGVHPRHRREGVAVGDGLAVGAEVGPHTERLPAAAHVVAEAAPDVVQDERGAEAVGECAQPVRVRRVHVLLVHEAVVAVRRGDDGGHVVRRLGRGPLGVGQVVEVELDDVGPVLGGHPGEHGRAPGSGAVVRGPGLEHLAAAGGGARDGEARRRGVGAVLGEHRPVGVGDGVDEQLGQLDERRARPVQAVALGQLRLVGGVDAGVLVAEDHRPPGAHEVEVAVAVDVPQPGALPAGEELRVVRRERRPVEVPVHAPGDHPGGTGGQRPVHVAGTGRGQGGGAHGALLVVGRLDSTHVALTRSTPDAAVTSP